MRGIFFLRKSLIPAVVIVLVLAAVMIFQNTSDEEKEISRIQEILNDRYNASFIYEGKEVKNIPGIRAATLKKAYTNIQGGKTLYYFHPADNENLRFYVIHGTGTTEMVLDFQEYCYDNLMQALFDDTVKDKRFVYTSGAKDELIDAMYKAEIEYLDRAEKYNMTESDIKGFEDFIIEYNNDEYVVSVAGHTRKDVSEALERRLFYIASE